MEFLYVPCALQQDRKIPEYKFDGYVYVYILYLYIYSMPVAPHKNKQQRYFFMCYVDFLFYAYN